MKKKFKNSFIPYKPELKEKASDLRKQMTPAEKKFWNTLRTMLFYKEYTFNRQKPIGNYIVDFYCHKLGLVIELDGNSHGDIRAQAYDQNRTLWLENQGLKVLRFTNPEVNNKLNGVMQILERVIEEKKDELSPR